MDRQPTGGPAAGADRPPRLRLLVVDADRRVRAGLAGLLDLVAEIQVVGSVGHAQAAVDACADSRPDAVVIDPRLPDLPDGAAFIRGLRRSQPDVRVVVVAWSPSLAAHFGDDPSIRVVAADGVDLAERIVEALERPGGRGEASGPEADAILGTTA